MNGGRGKQDSSIWQAGHARHLLIEQQSSEVFGGGNSGEHLAVCLANLSAGDRAELYALAEQFGRDRSFGVHKVLSVGRPVSFSDPIIYQRGVSSGGSRHMYV